ncbi:MAG: hypothetical protein IT343_21980 [Candidatus Melainabacteria bacterium]|nr:hypothetical protein [Candidatus Melainabacteria bacterium]
MVATIRIAALSVLAVFVCLLWTDNPLPLGTGDVRTIDVFWKLIVPLVPGILLVAPAVWRNICPLAYFNVLGHRGRAAVVSALGSSEPKRRGLLTVGHLWISRYGLYAGMALLFVLVPLRLLLLNTAGEILAILLVVLAVLSFSAGVFFPYKSGWCSSMCPVYPVEKFYGMSPLAFGENTLCHTQTSAGERKCSGCTRECLDVKLSPASGPKMVAQVGASPGVGMCLFISTFPGFVTAYWTFSAFAGLHDLNLALRCVLVYGGFLVAMSVSSIIYHICRRLLDSKGAGGAGVRKLDLYFVAIAFNLYYLMAIPASVATAASLLGIQTGAHTLAVHVAIVAATASLSMLWLRRSMLVIPADGR